MNKIPAHRHFSDISVGDTARFERTINAQDVLDFARLSGDENPLHMDDAYAQKTSFGRRLVHGMLIGALCSRMVGMHLPGESCLYLRQTLSFKKPVYMGDTVEVIGTVQSKSPATRVIDVDISVRKGREEVVCGVATVQVRD